MKKLVVVLAALSVAGAVLADVVVNHSNKASPATVVAKNFEKAVGEDKINFYQASNCEEAEQTFQNSKNSVMIYNADVGIAALAKGLNCPLNAKENNVVFVGKSYLKLCTRPGKTVLPFKQARTLGAASVIMSKGLIEDYNANGLALKGVPYGGSKDVLAAVIAGDVDYGFIASSIADPAVVQGSVVCPWSTDPRDTNFVGRQYKLKVPELPIVKVFYANTTDAQFIAAMKSAVKTSGFQEYIKSAGYNNTKIDGITQKDIDLVKQHINDSYNYYWK